MNLVEIDFERCKECGFCLYFCTSKVLKTGSELNKRGYYATVVADMSNCIACGICARVCPDNAIEVYKDI